jgi:carbon monoxide dehydrogenase subunit G
MMIAVWVVGGLVALVALLAAAGACLPRGHVATSAVRIAKPPQAIWDVAADYATWNAWAPGVESMERLADCAGRPVWAMVSRHGSMPWVVETDDPPRRRVTRILDDGLPFGGSWTWEIEPDGAGTRVSITEGGFIRNVVFRALARFVFGHHGTIEKFLAALAKRLGDGGTTIERVR